MVPPVTKILTRKSIQPWTLDPSWLSDKRLWGRIMWTVEVTGRVSAVRSTVAVHAQPLQTCFSSWSLRPWADTSVDTGDNVSGDIYGFSLPFSRIQSCHRRSPPRTPTVKRSTYHRTTRMGVRCFSLLWSTRRLLKIYFQQSVENIFSAECNGIILMQMTSITWFLSMVRDEKGACFTLGTFISKLIIDRSCEPAYSTFTSAF